MTCPLEDYVQGWDRSQFSAMQSRGEVKIVLFEHRHVMAHRVPSNSDSLYVAARCFL